MISRGGTKAHFEGNIPEILEIMVIVYLIISSIIQKLVHQASLINMIVRIIMLSV